VRGGVFAQPAGAEAEKNFQKPLTALERFRIFRILLGEQIEGRQPCPLLATEAGADGLLLLSRAAQDGM
jgi:hypothetical protein